MAMFHSKLLVYPSGVGSNTGWHPSGGSDEVMAVISQAIPPVIRWEITAVQTKKKILKIWDTTIYHDLGYHYFEKPPYSNLSMGISGS